MSRRASTETPESENEPTESNDDDEPVTKGNLREMVREIVSEVVGTGSSEPEAEGETDQGEPEALPSLRQQELTAEKAVRAALRDVNIHVHPSSQAKEKKEPEEAPGGKSFLTRLVGLS